VLHSDKAGGGGFGLELKGPTDRLSQDQTVMHSALERFGLPVLVSRYAEIEAFLKKKGRKFAARPDLDEFTRRARQLTHDAMRLESEAKRLRQEAELLGAVGDAPLIAFDVPPRHDPFAEVRRKMDAFAGQA
jgi:hypothetical protein